MYGSLNLSYDCCKSRVSSLHLSNLWKSCSALHRACAGTLAELCRLAVPRPGAAETKQRCTGLCAQHWGDAQHRKCLSLLGCTDINTKHKSPVLQCVKTEMKVTECRPLPLILTHQHSWIFSVEPQNHRPAQAGRIPERSAGPIFCGKEAQVSLSSILSSYILKTPSNGEGLHYMPHKVFLSCTRMKPPSVHLAAVAPVLSMWLHPCARRPKPFCSPSQGRFSPFL